MAHDLIRGVVDGISHAGLAVTTYLIPEVFVALFVPIFVASPDESNQS